MTPFLERVAALEPLPCLLISLLAIGMLVGLAFWISWREKRRSR